MLVSASRQARRDGGRKLDRDGSSRVASEPAWGIASAATTSKRCRRIDAPPFGLAPVSGKTIPASGRAIRRPRSSDSASRARCRPPRLPLRRDVGLSVRCPDSVRFPPGVARFRGIRRAVLSPDQTRMACPTAGSRRNSVRSASVGNCGLSRSERTRHKNPMGSSSAARNWCQVIGGTR